MGEASQRHINGLRGGRNSGASPAFGAVNFIPVILYQDVTSDSGEMNGIAAM